MNDVFPMKMRSLVLAAAGLLAPLVPVSGQSLADVLSSIQERQRAVEQSDQVFEHYQSALNGGSSTVSNQDLIEWEGLSGTDFPGESNLSSMDIGERVALLNQAVVEFKRLQRSFLNIRPEDLSTNAEIGALRPFMREDFPTLGRVTEGSYHVVLNRLAKSVLKLQVLPWPVAGIEQSKDYEVEKFEAEELHPYTFEMIGIEEYDLGSDTVPGWEPDEIGPGSISSPSTSWLSKAPGSTLGESVWGRADFGSDAYVDDDYGPYTLRSLSAEMHQKHVSDAMLLASVPGGRPDQIGGKVALLSRSLYTPSESGDYTAPANWNNQITAHHVEVIVTDATGQTSLGDPDIELNIQWFSVGSNDETAIPSGFESLKAYYQGGDPDDLFDTWEAASDGSQGMIILPALARSLVAVAALSFSKGLNEGAQVASLESSTAFSRPPSGDALPVLHPAPGILLGIPVGVGIEEDFSGWVGWSPGDMAFHGEPVSETEFTGYVDTTAASLFFPKEVSGSARMIRFDHGSNLRFIGPAEDFHVVYEASRSNRGAGLPAEIPSATEESASGWDSSPGAPRFVEAWDNHFFNAWDAPRLRQVISRDYLIDITHTGHFACTIKVYRRAASAGAVDRTPGNLETPSGTLVRTLLCSNPNAGSAPYPATPERIDLVEGTSSWKVWRDGLETQYSPNTNAIRFSMTDNSAQRFSKVIDFPQSSSTQITTSVDGLTVYQDVISGAWPSGNISGGGSVGWNWWDDRSAQSITRTSAGETIVFTQPIDNTSVGSQNGSWPESVTIDYPDRPDLSIAWEDSGVTDFVQQGPWRREVTPESGGLKTEIEFSSSRIGTTWIEWSGDDHAGTDGPWVKVYSAPDGSASSKSANDVDWTMMELGDTAGSGLPGLPRLLTRKDGSGTTWSWTPNPGGDSTVDVRDGLLSGTSVSHGARTMATINKKGFGSGSEEYLIQSGATLKLSGTSVLGGQTNTWGVPEEFEDYTSGLSKTITSDSKDRITTTQSPFGVATTFSNFDGLGRPGAFDWNGNSGGSLTYNNSGFGVSSSINIGGRTVASSDSWDALGRTTGGSVTSGGTSSFTLLHDAVGKTLATSDSTTGASGTVEMRTDDGSLEDATGNTLPFGGVDGTPMTVDGGLLKSTISLGGLSASFRTTWTDAWGRVRKSMVAGTDGTGDDETNFIYSDPDSTTKKVEVQHASGRVMIRETEPWAAGGIITRSGLDKNENGLLDAGDRFITSATDLVGATLRTTVTQTGNSTDLLVRLHTPAAGVTTTVLNGGEVTITEVPDFSAKTLTTTRTQENEVVETRTVALNNLGQPDQTTISGPGISSATVDPDFRDDGSLASFSVVVGGVQSTVNFEQDGTIGSISIPNRQNPGGANETLPVDHHFAAGDEVFEVDGTTRQQSLDGSANSLTGAGVMDRDRSTVVSAGGFAETIDPAEGANTVLASNAAGAKTLHNYAAGSDTQTTWLPGGLLDSVSLGRGGGSTVFGYSADGARDLVSIAWPAAYSSGFATEPFYGDTITLSRDDADNIDSITDRSGERDLDYDKNRLTTTDWLDGDLDAYKVVRAYDATGRPDTVTIFRNGASIHATDFGYTGQSDEISGVTASGFSASYGRDATNRTVTSVTRGTVIQNWGRAATGRITSAGSNITDAPDFGYTGFDTKGRRKTVVTNKGTWSYAHRGGDGGDGQLVSATSTGSDLGDFLYGLDGIGRRVDFAVNQSDPLNRFLGMTHPQVAKKLYISADPLARVWFNGVELHQAPDDFDGFTVALLGHPGSGGGWVPWEVKGQIDGGGDSGAHPDAVAESSGQVYFPPTQEDFTYDADGNREGSALWDYGWDGRNRLVRAATRDRSTAAEGWDLRFDYDAEGRRFKKQVTRYENGQQVENKTIWFVWDGWDLLYERHEDGFGNFLFDRKYVWGPDISGLRGGVGGAGGLLLMREKRGQTTRDFYPLYDGSGHVVGLSDDSGNLVAEYWYGPFGELIEARGEMADANPCRYATKYYDKETGLYYWENRYYDPVSGQWMRRDPSGEKNGLNLYAYCGNCPVDNVDLRGLAQAAVNSDNSLNSFGHALVALAKIDPQAARSMLLAAQVQAETSGIGGLIGAGSGAAIENTSLGIRDAVGRAFDDGKIEWIKIANGAGQAEASKWWSSELPSRGAVATNVLGGYAPQISAAIQTSSEAELATLASERRTNDFYNSWRGDAVLFGNGFAGLAADVVNEFYFTPFGGAEVAWQPFGRGDGDSMHFDIRNASIQEAALSDRAWTVIGILPIGWQAKGSRIARLGGVVDSAPKRTPQLALPPFRQAEGGLVIGRSADLSRSFALAPNEFKLSWPATATTRSEWKINSGLLRTEMGKGIPIRDASPGNVGGMYLNAERNLLQSRGWNYNSANGYWNPPGN